MSGKIKLEVEEYSFVFEDGDEYALIRTEKGKDRWKIYRNRNVLGTDFEWHWEPQPSNRTEEFTELTRMNLLMAFAILKQWKKSENKR